MNFAEKLKKVIREKGSYVCVGLDTDVKRIPEAVKGGISERIAAFNRAIIEATVDYACAYKCNMAFYEAAGKQGYDALHESLRFFPLDALLIIDAKRGDIGNTSAQYARAVFEILGGDAVTVNPYMGYDSIEPFMEYEDKGIFVLCLTSNAGSSDFQKLNLADGGPMYMEVARKITEWNTRGNMGMVVGATHPDELMSIREIAPDIPILIPGIGAQKGDLEKTVRAGIGKNRAPALINSSRGIIYASSGEDFAEAAGRKCRELRDGINAIINFE